MGEADEEREKSPDRYTDWPYADLRRRPIMSALTDWKHGRHRATYRQKIASRTIIVLEVQRDSQTTRVAETRIERCQQCIQLALLSMRRC